MTHRILRTSVLSLGAVLGLGSLGLMAAPIAFDFKDPKGVNNIQFQLDAPLEAISGSGNGVSGSISFDPANPSATAGKISLATASLTVGNATMKEHMHGGMWLDVAKYPEISFEASALSDVKTTGNKTVAKLTGKLTVKDVSKVITVPVTLTYLEGKLGDRVQGAKGDLLVVRSAFTINRSDYGIMAGKASDKVSEEIQLTLSIAGAAQR